MPTSFQREHQPGVGAEPGQEGLPTPASALEGSAESQANGAQAFTEDVRVEAERRLREGWTPEIISGRARMEGRPWVCKETIYKPVYTEAKAAGGLWRNQPRAHRKRRRRRPRVDGRGRGEIPNQRMIDTRPRKAERHDSGHLVGEARTPCCS